MTWFPFLCCLTHNRGYDNECLFQEDNDCDATRSGVFLTQRGVGWRNTYLETEGMKGKEEEERREIRRGGRKGVVAR